MSSVSENTTVLLIGASRGLGYAIAEEYIDRGSQVVATVRGPGRTALHELQEIAGGRLEVEHVDINAREQVQALRDRLSSRTFDLLFVNAGVTNGPEETPADVSTEEFTRLMVTNALSPMRVIETLGELVTPNGTIAIMSSGQGSVANNERGGFEIYRASKSALNQLMRSYAARHHDDNRTLLLMAPGGSRQTSAGPTPASPSTKASQTLSRPSTPNAAALACNTSTTSARPSPGEEPGADSAAR
jgi:NAD(P)-dependent dehydrogenase (short-subunit alcohol dehydrogenase family)